MLIKKYIPLNTKRSSGQKLLGVKFIVAHDTGNPNSTALQNVNYYINTANEIEASAHTFIDDIDTIECIDQNYKAWHVLYSTPVDNQLFGADANDYAIGVELCYFPQDVVRSLRAYNNYVGYIKELCTKYNLEASKFVTGHFKLDPARKTDPMNAFKVIGKSWEQFIEDLKPSLKSKEDIKKEIINLLNQL